MEVVVASDKQQWNNFLLQNPRDGLFLQSWEWGEMLMSTGQMVKRLQVMNNGAVVAQVQLVVKSLPFGMNYALAAKGPVVSKEQRTRNMEQAIVEALMEHLKSKKCIFFRFEPLLLTPYSLLLTNEVRDINPPATLVLDITPDENALLANMHEKTRYNIRLAEKKGLHATCEKNFDIFWKLLQKTGERDDFALHAKASYEKIMSSDTVQQTIVWNGQTPVATAGLIGFGDTMYYLYGASDHMYRQMMGPHLMQWEAIKLGKKLGYKKYDFFGIAPRSKKQENNKTMNQSEYMYDSEHRYAGVTRFKLGFGGAVHEEPGTFDLIIDRNRYRMYKLIRKIRSII